MEHKVGLRDKTYVGIQIPEQVHTQEVHDVVTCARYDDCVKELECAEKHVEQLQGKVERLEEMRDAAVRRANADSERATLLAADVERLDRQRQYNLKEWSRAFHRVNELEQKLKEIRWEAVTYPRTFADLQAIRTVLDR